MAAPASTDVTAESEDPASTAATSDSGPLRRVRTVAHLLDEAFRIPGTEIRFGLDPLLSVLPVVGSIAGAVFPLYIVLEAALAGASKTTLGTMLAVVAVDTVVGAIPFVGPIADALWTANVWNARILADHVADAGQYEPIAMP